MRDLGLLPAPAYIQNLDHSLLNYLDVQFRRIEENWRTLDSLGPSGIKIPAENVLAGSFGAGTYTFSGGHIILADGGLGLYSPWIELRSIGGNPGIDFTRTPGSADFNMRLINDANGRLNLQGGAFVLDGIARVSPDTEPGWTYARFSHNNFTGFTDYAVLQANDGTTLINAKSGFSLCLRNGNANKMIVNSTDTSFQAPLNIAGQKIWTKQYNDDTHRIQHSGGLDSLEFFTWVEHRFISAGALRHTVNNDIWTNGLYKGGWGGNGAGLRDRSGDNAISFDWDGTFRMWVDSTNVKNFIIDHPVEKEKYLIHACIEGPEAAVFYRGQSQLVDGWVEVKLPDYFEALCKEENRTVQLTPIADNPEDAWCPVLHATYPKNGRFFVGLGSGMAVRDQKFWWLVMATRRDASINVEPNKKDVVVMGSGPYTYYKEK